MLNHPQFELFWLLFHSWLAPRQEALAEGHCGPEAEIVQEEAGEGEESFQAAPTDLSTC